MGINYQPPTVVPNGDLAAVHRFIILQFQLLIRFVGVSYCPNVHLIFLSMFAMFYFMSGDAIARTQGGLFSDKYNRGL